MKLLYGTGNPAKLSAMKNRLESLDIELMGLNDLKAEGCRGCIRNNYAFEARGFVAALRNGGLIWLF